MIILLLFLHFSKELILKNGIYNLKYNNLYFNYENQSLQLSTALKDELNSFFRINNIFNISNNLFYFIQDINTNLYLNYVK
jgi:hypothetical protein